MSYPTDEAWAYFLLHHDNIRACCEQLAPGEIAAFDAAVGVKDSESLVDILQRVWTNTPIELNTNSIRGFSQMCELIDFPVEGFVEDPGVDDDED